MKTDRSVVILGGSGIGMIACSIMDKLGGFVMQGFLNDSIEVGQTVGRFKSYPVVGKSGDVQKCIKKFDALVFVAYIGMTRERETVDKIGQLEIPPDRLLTLIDPTAVVPERFCEIGSGSLICPLAQLSADTRLGQNVILLPNCFVGHDSTLEDYVSVANNAALGANLHVGRGAHIGTNASIRERVTIGPYSVVGMAANVLHDVPADCIVAGNPAKEIRKK